MLIINEVNKHGVSNWFIKLMSTILRVMYQEQTEIWETEKNSFASVLQRFCSQMQNSFLKCESLHKYFSRILLIDSKVPTLKTDFFEGIFKEFCRKISE